MAKDFAILRGGRLVLGSPLGSEHVEISADSEAWFAWLSTAKRFIFDEYGLHFTARKRHRSGMDYWYAFRRYEGRLREIYLGKVSELTLGKLRAASSRFDAWASQLPFAPAPTKTQDTAPREARLRSDPDPIAASSSNKPRAPMARMPRIVRTRAMERVGQILNFPLTVVSAPAGSGKTSLIASWTPPPGWNMVWIPLDQGDNHLSQFCQHVRAALGSLLPRHDEPPPPSTSGAELQPGDNTNTTLLAEIAAIPSPTVLILDDFDVLRSDNVTVHTSMVKIVRRLPAHVRMVILSRTIPRLPLAKLRASHELLELHAADLEFTFSEAKEFFALRAPPNLTDTQAAALWARTQGWVTGLEFAALTLQKQQQNLAPYDIDRSIDEFGGENPYVFDYLVEEVLNRLSRRVRTFVLHTAVLNQLSAPLCDAVSQSNDSRAFLNKLERINLFLVPLDGRRDWYRYHPLLADVARRYLRETQPGLAQQLLGRASRWCESNGRALDALDYAFAAHEPERAAELLEAYLPLAHTRDERLILLDRLNRLPDEVMQGRTRLTVAHAYSLLMTEGDRSLIRRRVYQAYKSLTYPQSPSDPSQRLLLLQEALSLSASARFLLGKGSVQDLIVSHERALAAFPLHHWLRIFTNLFIGIEQLADGDVREAGRTLEFLLHECKAQDQRFWVEIVSMYLGVALLQQGRLDDAWEICNAAERDQPTDEKSETATWTAFIRGMVLIERNRMSEAISLLDQGISLRYDPVPYFSETYLALARAQLATGNTDSALQVVAQSLREWTQAQAEHKLMWAWSGREMDANQAKLNLLAGHVAAASEWARSVEDLHASTTSTSSTTSTGADAPTGAPTRVRELEEIVLARTYLAERQSPRALAKLEPLGEAAAKAGRRLRQFEVLILQAIARDLEGDVPTALSLLQRALMLATPQRFIRVFLDGGAEVRRLLGLLQAKLNQQGVRGRQHMEMVRHLAHLTAAFTPRAQASGRVRAARTLSSREKSTVRTSSLTARQSQILRLIATGASNQQIADELVISVATVKRHVSNILMTLNVRSRTQAVAQARRSGLPLSDAE